jgi:hypothetical protein
LWTGFAHRKSPEINHERSSYSVRRLWHRRKKHGEAMTWICAASNILGDCALHSDVQVTFRDSTTKDLVQKAFPLTNSIAAGFAGSVRIGFSLLDSLSSFLQLAPEDDPDLVGWDPRWVSNHWAPIARSVFESADSTERRLGAHILMAAASPDENCGLGSKFYFTRFASPHFKPGIMAKPFSFCSIGSGSRVAEYHKTLRPLFRWSGHVSTLQANVMNPHGWSRNLSFRISQRLANHPHLGISRHMHTIIIGRRLMIVENNDENIYRGDNPPIEIRMPPVATNYRDFTALAAANSVDAAEATC